MNVPTPSCSAPATPALMMVKGKDFLRVGTRLTLLVLVVTLVAINLLFR